MSSKKYSELIEKNVYLVNVRYTKMMNKTKALYFKCLDEGRSTEYFKSEVSKIWDNVDHRFMDKQIAKLQDIVHDNNVEQAINLGRFKNKQYVETLGWTFDDEYFKLTPESDFIAFEQRFKKNVESNYQVARKSIENTEKQEYLVKKMDSYNRQINQVVAYYHKTGKLAHYVKLSSYLAMVHNTDLTRSGWNTTLNDAKTLGRDKFIIPYHPFSCLKCYEKQNKPLSAEEVKDIIGVEAMEQSGNLLHPNCKCTLSIYWSPTQISNEWKSDKEVDMEYKVRQKVNSLTLERTNLKADMKIYELIGDESKVDYIRQKISKINKVLREEVGKLPTSSLKIQVKAINR